MISNRRNRIPLTLVRGWSVPYHKGLSPSFNADIGTQYAYFLHENFYISLINFFLDNSFYFNFLISPENRNFKL